MLELRAGELLDPGHAAVAAAGIALDRSRRFLYPELGAGVAPRGAAAAVQYSRLAFSAVTSIVERRFGDVRLLGVHNCLDKASWVFAVSLQDDEPAPRAGWPFAGLVGSPPDTKAPYFIPATTAKHGATSPGAPIVVEAASVQQLSRKLAARRRVEDMMAAEVAASSSSDTASPAVPAHSPPSPATGRAAWRVSHASASDRAVLSFEHEHASSAPLRMGALCEASVAAPAGLGASMRVTAAGPSAMLMDSRAVPRGAAAARSRHGDGVWASAAPQLPGQEFAYPPLRASRSSPSLHAWADAASRPGAGSTAALPMRRGSALGLSASFSSDSPLREGSSTRGRGVAARSASFSSQPSARPDRSLPPTLVQEVRKALLQRGMSRSLVAAWNIANAATSGERVATPTLPLGMRTGVGTRGRSGTPLPGANSSISRPGTLPWSASMSAPWSASLPSSASRHETATWVTPPGAAQTYKYDNGDLDRPRWSGSSESHRRGSAFAAAQQRSLENSGHLFRRQLREDKVVPAVLGSALGARRPDDFSDSAAVLAELQRGVSLDFSALHVQKDVASTREARRSSTPPAPSGLVRTPRDSPVAAPTSSPAAALPTPTGDVKQSPGLGVQRVISPHTPPDATRDSLDAGPPVPDAGAAVAADSPRDAPHSARSAGSGVSALGRPPSAPRSRRGSLPGFPSPDLYTSDAESEAGDGYAQPRQQQVLLHAAPPADEDGGLETGGAAAALRSSQLRRSVSPRGIVQRRNSGGSFSSRGSGRARSAPVSGEAPTSGRSGYSREPSPADALQPSQELGSTSRRSPAPSSPAFADVDDAAAPRPSQTPSPVRMGDGVSDERAAGKSVPAAGGRVSVDACARPAAVTASRLPLPRVAASPTHVTQPAAGMGSSAFDVASLSTPQLVELQSRLVAEAAVRTGASTALLTTGGAHAAASPESRSLIEPTISGQGAAGVTSLDRAQTPDEAPPTPTPAVVEVLNRLREDVPAVLSALHHYGLASAASPGVLEGADGVTAEAAPMPLREWLALPLELRHVDAAPSGEAPEAAGSVVVAGASLLSAAFLHFSRCLSPSSPPAGRATSPMLDGAGFRSLLSALGLSRPSSAAGSAGAQICGTTGASARLLQGLARVERGLEQLSPPRTGPPAPRLVSPDVPRDGSSETSQGGVPSYAPDMCHLLFLHAVRTQGSAMPGSPTGESETVPVHRQQAQAPAVSFESVVEVLAALLLGWQGRPVAVGDSASINGALLAGTFMKFARVCLAPACRRIGPQVSLASALAATGSLGASAAPYTLRSLTMDADGIRRLILDDSFEDARCGFEGRACLSHLVTSSRQLQWLLDSNDATLRAIFGRFADVDPPPAAQGSDMRNDERSRRRDSWQSAFEEFVGPADFQESTALPHAARGRSSSVASTASVRSGAAGAAPISGLASGAVERLVGGAGTSAAAKSVPPLVGVGAAGGLSGSPDGPRTARSGRSASTRRSASARHSVDARRRMSFAAFVAFARQWGLWLVLCDESHVRLLWSAFCSPAVEHTGASSVRSKALAAASVPLPPTLVSSDFRFLLLGLALSSTFTARAVRAHVPVSGRSASLSTLLGRSPSASSLSHTGSAAATIASVLPAWQEGPVRFAALLSLMESAQSRGRIASPAASAVASTATRGLQHSCSTTRSTLRSPSPSPRGASAAALRFLHQLD